MKKSTNSVLLIATFVFSNLGIAQFKTYQPGSIQESYLLMSSKNLINGFRFYPQTPELVAAAWNKSLEKPKSNDRTDTLDGILTKLSFPREQVKRASDYFYYNHPEYHGCVRAGLGNKSWVKSIGKNSLWATPAWFYSYRDDKDPQNNYFVINPIVDVELNPPSSPKVLQNGRGAEVMGKIGGRVAFTSQLYEAQSFARKYTQNYMDSIGVIPGVGFWMKNAWNYSDYFMARGSVYTNLVNTASDKNHILLSFGHDNQFIGYGYRSLILSNFSPASAYLRLNSRIGPFTYQNLYKELTTGDGFFAGSHINEKKYLASHRGALEFGKTGFELGLNEMIIHHRANGGFDMNYLNPIIFYRSLERDLGSGDNALVAFDARYKRKMFTLYGQLLLDEFNLKEVVKGGNWSNKQGYQLGALIQPKIDQFGDLLFQIEFNSVRPYTYSHWDQYTSYTNYNQPLAHPLGSNFREGVFRAVIKPRYIPGFTLIHTTMIAMKGFDPYQSGPNYGGNILRSYNSRVQDDNVQMYQGEFARIINTKTQILYEVMHNMWVTLNAQYRGQSGFQKSHEYYFSLGWKWNWYEETQLF